MTLDRERVLQVQHQSRQLRARLVLACAGVAGALGLLALMFDVPIAVVGGFVSVVIGAAVGLLYVQERMRWQEREQALVGRLSALERERDELASGMDALLHSVGHDLRAPIRGVRGFVELVLEHYDTGREDCRYLLHRAAQAGQRLDAMVTAAATLAKARKIHPPLQEIPLEDVVGEALRGLPPDTVTRGEIRIAERFGKAPVDPAWATRAVQQLVSNSLKFTPPGSVPVIEVEPFESGAETGLVVRDRGIGVSPDHTERMFNLFQRGVGFDIEGIGSGLALVREVAARHGGHAWLRPRDGGGAEAYLTFRRRPQAFPLRESDAPLDVAS